MDIPSLFMIPSAVSSGKVHSVFPNSTDADFDFNRDSDATRVNSEGLIERVGYYGSELVVNGNYDNNSAWTISGGNAEISNGKLNFDNAANYGTSVSNSASVVSGKTYLVKFTISNYSSGAAQIRLGSQFGTSRNANGTYTEYIVANATLIRLYSSSNNTTLSIDNVSVKEVLGDRARLNYEIEGGLVNTKCSLLLENQSTNKLTTSNDFSSYSKSGTITVTSNYGISPTGERNSTRVQFGGGNNSFYKLSVHSGNTESNSIYVKGVSGETIKFGKGTTVNAGIAFTLNGEWQRIQHQSTTGNQFAINTYSSVTARDIEIFGAQIEEQSYATSLIPTNGSTQTRAAETCNGAGTSSIFESTEGILYAEIAALANPTSQEVALCVSEGQTGVNRLLIRMKTNGAIGIVLRVANNTEASIDSSSLDQSVNHKVAVKWKVNDIALWIDGSQVGTDTSANVFSANTLNEVSFNQGNNSNQFYGKCRDIRVYNTKEMTDSEVDILLTKITS